MGPVYRTLATYEPLIYIALAIGGLWFWMFLTELKKRQMLAVGDPYLRESLATAGGHH